MATIASREQGYVDGRAEGRAEAFEEDLKHDEGQTLVDPLFDEAFTRIFGREESKPVTRSLVNAVFEHVGLDPIGEIEEISAEHTSLGSSIGFRSARMDVRLVTEGNRLVDLEAQRYPEDIDARSSFYAAKLISDGTSKGGTYKDVPQAIVITLLDYHPAFPGDEYAHMARMTWCDPAGDAVTCDRIIFAVVELSKIRERYNQLTDEMLSDKLLSWVYLLVGGYAKKDEVYHMLENIPDMKEFAELYGLAADDPKVKIAYEDFISAARERQSEKDFFERIERESREQGYVDGHAEGRAEGRAEAFEELVAALRDQGVDEDALQSALAMAHAE